MGLLEKQVDDNSVVITVNGTSRVSLWENCGNLPSCQFAGSWAEGNHEEPSEVRACSACAGDYEDPDRTAWTSEADEGEDESAPETAEEEFPVE